MNQDAHTHQWLIRDATNLVWGPVPREDMIELLRDNKLKTRTEICQSASYWFYIEERKEVLGFFPELADMLPEIDPNDATQVSVNAVTKTVPGEWLSEELKEEFGYVVNSVEDGTTVAVRRASNAPEVLSRQLDQTQPTLRVQPMDELTDPTLTFEDGILENQKRAQKKQQKIFIGALVVVVGALLVFSVMESTWTARKQNSRKLKPQAEAGDKSLGATIDRLRAAILIGDLAEIQREISALDELQSESNSGNVSNRLLAVTGISKAIMRREYLVDTAGAVSLLQNLAPQLIVDEEAASAIANLQGIYLLDSAPEESIRLILAAQKKHPEDETLQFNSAVAFIAGGIKDRAIPILTNLAQKLPETNRLRPHALVALGQAQTKNAEELYSQALRDDPYFDEARLLLAMEQLRINRGSEAVKNLRMFIDGLPGYRISTELQNFRLAELPQVYSGARNELRQWMSKVSPDDLLLAVDGHLSLLLGETREAEQAFDRALQKSPGSLYALKGMAYMRLKEGREIEIENMIRSKSAENRHSLAFSVLLAISYLKQGRFKDAETTLREFMEGQKVPAFVVSLLGDALAAQGKKDEALQSFQRALSVNPRDLGALRGLAKAGQGKQIAWEKFSELVPF